jgi:hypothetical protein
LIDVEFTVDDDQFKAAHLPDDDSGVSDVTDDGLCDAFTTRLLRADWGEDGIAPKRSIVTTRTRNADGDYADVYIPADPGINAA